MAITLDKTITRNSGNIINTDTNYSELNVKANGLVEGIVDHIETELGSVEAQVNADLVVLDARISALASATDTVYSNESIDKKNILQNEANFSAYGYTKALTVEERFLETNTPNVVVDKVVDDVRFSDGLYERLGGELITNGWNNSGVSSAVNNGQVTVTITGTANWEWYNIQQVIPVENGKTYLISVTQLSHNCYYAGVIISTDSTLGSVDLYFGTYFGTGEETQTILYTATTTGNAYFKLTARGDLGKTVTYDNISVHEVQQATLPVAPFAPTSTDELLDDKVNGLTCQMAHSKGDIVVTGNELVTNGTFDTDPNVEWTLSSGATWNNTNGTINVPQTATPVLDGQAPFVLGAYNTVTYTLSNVVGTGGFEVYIYDAAIPGYIYQGASTSNGTFTKTFFVPLTAQTAIRFKGTWGGTCEVDNISVKLADNIYQAKVDTTTGALLSDTTKFQVLPQVTRQDVITLRKNKITKVVDYHTFKGTKYFGEGYSQADVMSYYGYSQVDKNLWEDATYEYVFVELKNSLNAGAYHPVYNIMGTFLSARESDGVAGATQWYSSTVKIGMDSMYESILFRTQRSDQLGAVGGYSGRPDSKFYDKVYLNGFGGLIPSSKYLAYAGKEMPRLLDSESNELLSESWLEEGVEIVECLMAYAITTNYIAIEKGTSGARNEPRDFTASNIKVGGSIYVSNGEIGRIETVDEQETYYRIYLDRAISSTTSDTILIPFTKPHLLTYKSSTTTDIIGSPSNYPTDWLSHLASGKSIVGNALLVGQDGTSCIPDGTSKEYIFCKKGTEGLNSQYSNNSGDTWASTTAWNIYMMSVGNSHTDNIVTGQIRLMNYQSANQSALQSDPQRVLQVQPKAIASNSHSVYKGAMMTYAGTGKVAVGNGSNGLESRLVENVDIPTEPIDIIVNVVMPLVQGEFYWIYEDSISAEFGVGIYERTGASTASYTPTTSHTYGTAFGWEFRGISATTPDHNTISLDNSNSPATKWFTTLAEMEDGELAIQTFSEEGKYNVSGYGWATGTGLTFEQLSNGTKDGVYEDALQTKTLIKRLGIWA